MGRTATVNAEGERGKSSRQRGKQGDGVQHPCLLPLPVDGTKVAGKGDKGSSNEVASVWRTATAYEGVTWRDAGVGMRLPTQYCMLCTHRLTPQPNCICVLLSSASDQFHCQEQ